MLLFSVLCIYIKNISFDIYIYIYIWYIHTRYTLEVVAQRCSVKMAFLKISRSSQKIPVPESQPGLRPATLLKKDPGTGVFL